MQNKIKPSLLFLGLVIIYYFLGLIPLDHMLKNFVNKSLVTLVLLILVSLVLEQSSFISLLSEKIFSKSYSKSLLKMSLFTSAFSAFLNNTAVVASMISVVKKNRYHTPSKLLLPLSYAAIFGGTVTLIGTSTNLIINGFVIERGLKPLNLFDFSYVGIPIIIIGTFVLYFVGRFLPENKEEIHYESYFLEAQVSENSKLVGKSVEKNGLRNLEYLFLSEILRDGNVLSPVSPNEIICKKDILIFSGDIKQVQLLKKFDGLNLDVDKHMLDNNFVEVIISHESALVGMKIKESNFRNKFDASVVAVKRGDKKLSGKLGDIVLQVGDNLVLSVGKDFDKRDNLGKNFYIIEKIGIKKGLTNNQSLIAIIGFIGILTLNFFHIFPLIKGLFILLGFFIIFGYLDLNQIKRRFPFELLIIIGSALGIASVMIDSGLAHKISEIIQGVFNDYGVYGAFIGVYLMTFLLTEIITNNAAAALSFPIAYALSLSYGCDPMPFIMAVVYGASASFLTPYGYQTNMMVASVGGYSFKNFLQVGSLISLVYSMTVIFLVPMFFPF